MRPEVLDLADKLMQNRTDLPFPAVSLRQLWKIVTGAGTPPPTYPECDLVLPSIEGWQVQYFYDAGELDYIEQFVMPDGTIIDPWDLPEGDPRRWLVLGSELPDEFPPTTLASGKERP